MPAIEWPTSMSTPHRIEENEWVRSAALDQRAAQRELFHRLASRVHEALYAALGSNDRMEEHLEDAFIEIFRSLRSYDHELDLDTWACTIATRSARRRLEEIAG